jgi:hypothetical protein
LEDEAENALRPVLDEAPPDGASGVEANPLRRRQDLLGLGARDRVAPIQLTPAALARSTMVGRFMAQS